LSKSSEDEIAELKEAIQLLRQKEADLQEDLVNANLRALAWERMYEFLISEKKEDRQIIHAHENLSILYRMEKKDARFAIDTMKAHQKLSHKEIQKKTLTLKNLLHLSKELAYLPKTELLLDHIIASIMKILFLERGVLYMYKNERLEGINFVRITPAELNEVSFEPSRQVIQKCFHSGQTQICVYKQDEYRKGVNFALVIVSPILRSEKVIGVIYFDSFTFHPYEKALDVDTIEIYSFQIALAIEMAVIYEHLEEEFNKKTKELNLANEKLSSIIRNVKNDMTLASKIQKKLLPGKINILDGLSLQIIYKPLFEIGGDFYDAFKVRSGVVRIFLADATGHGIQAALTTSLIKSEFDKLKDQDIKPAELLKMLNRSFLEKYKSLNVFFSAVILDINTNRREFSFCSGGHPTQLLLKKGIFTELLKSGKIIGIDEEVYYSNTVLSFEQGDRIFLFTDGVFEQFSNSQEIFGEERLCLSLNHDLSLSNTVHHAVKNLEKFIGVNGKFQDDLCLIGIEYA